MQATRILAASALLAASLPVLAQVPSPPQFKIDATTRVITVSAEELVSVDPDLAIVHIGFESKVADAKSAYADGSHTSNQIVAALKQAGLPDSAIRSESQQLEPVDPRNHKFKLVQTWTVKTPPERAAEILDAAISAGATDSGDIEWTVKDVHALEDQALERAAERSKSDATVLAKSTGSRLGALVYVSNQVAESQKTDRYRGGNFADLNASVKMRSAPPPLAIEPHKVSRTATVYAVFAIE